MTRFNRLKSAEGKTTNLAGGEAFVESPQLELALTVLGTFTTDQFYRTGDDTIARVTGLVPKAGPEFAAKAAVYARDRGMRSVSHVVAAEVAKGEKWTRPFYARVVQRPDDATEIAACWLASYGKPLPNAMKRGLADSFAKFDAYQLAKYRAENASLKLVDLVNLVRPKPAAGNAEALKALVAGELRSTETWEAKLSAAGAAAEDRDAKTELKKEAWTELVTSRRIGYFALLRNLRNILDQAPEAIPAALAMLEDERLIRGSKVLPFRYGTAWRELRDEAGAGAIVAALSRAAQNSLANVPAFDGSTLVALDCSGSMQGRPIAIGSMFAAALAGKGAELLLFSDDAKYLSVGGRDLFGDVAAIEQAMKMAGTNFHAIFQTARKAYDRIIILSDMQAWMASADGLYNTSGNPAKSFADYRKRTGASPRIFSFDLQGYGSLQFPEKDVYALAGFSDRAFEVMQLLEGDRRALLADITAVAF